MLRKDFYRKFAEENNIHINQAALMCDAVFVCLSRCVVKEDKVFISGFGTFKKKLRKERHGKHPITGLPTVIPEHEELVFSPSPLLFSDSEEQEESSNTGEEWHLWKSFRR